MSNVVKFIYVMVIETIIFMVLGLIGVWVASLFGYSIGLVNAGLITIGVITVINAPIVAIRVLNNNGEKDE